MKSDISQLKRHMLLGLAASLSLASCSQSENSDTQAQIYQTDDRVATDGLRLATLREASLRSGLSEAEGTWVKTDPKLTGLGKLLFESKLLSLNGAISCRDCHLAEFSSGDGLPNAIGAGGTGSGPERLHSGGAIVPRNALPLWGRGGRGFNTFFWDGKVQLVEGRVVSQFGDLSPSKDPLVVAVHLPSVELREMVVDNDQVRRTLVDEDVSSADQIYREITKRLLSDPPIGSKLVSATGKRRDDVAFGDVASALASFIRSEFRLRQTRLQKFVFENGPITKSELNGGILFYGRGRCSSCHNGPYFSDFGFHAVAFPEAGFGKNGFGIDEGRYNVTLDPKDRFLFRTPPLWNVAQTSPYSHSGSVGRLEDAIIAHFDPLRLAGRKARGLRERADLFQRLGYAANETLPAPLTDQEVGEIAAFLQMLSFKPDPASQE